MERIASTSNDWLLAVALAAGLLGSVALATHVPMTLAIGLGSSVAAAAVAAMLFRCMRCSTATRAALLFVFAISFVTSVRWLSTLAAS